MNIQEIKDYIILNFSNINLVEANGDLFFMHNDNNKLPFATIVTQDNEYDNFSNLNRENFFRLNIGLDKETFYSLFGGMASKTGLEAYLNLGIDFTKEDVVLPHPTYGALFWICIVKPSDEKARILKEYLKISYNRISKSS